MTKPNSFSGFLRGGGVAKPSARPAKASERDAEMRAAIEKSLADPRPNVPAEDVHDRLARRHEARLKRGP